MGPGADTYLLFVVGEFTLLVLLLGFVVIHSESDSLVALTRAVFFLLWRLSFLFRSVLLLLLQDSTFQRAPTDRRTVRVRPLTRASRYFGDINDKYKFIYFFFLKEGNGEREEKVSCVFSAQSDIPRHSLESFSGGSCCCFPKTKYSKCSPDCAAGKLLSSLLRVREGGREGGEGFRVG